MGEIIKVLDGIPVSLKGRFIDGEARTRFIHRCCHCKVRNSVQITKKPRESKITFAFRRLDNKKMDARSGNLTKIGDQEIFNLNGTEKGGGEIHARFVHCCHDCGLEHKVHIKKKPRSASMDITFVRLKRKNPLNQEVAL